ncbi:FAD-dependent oxidoreductase [Luteimonas wenzhouensis]|uniref:FAD-dependent oxidoreductase n=1 Tax=Luteimonas wenzhouensis TaxID=2599615 RepID=A0A5C5U905_9GAMM|nr:FAD-dependent oxidoreductase [Luteimonas wenzhouensis]NLW96186.1 FAD-dependent oxidoreductase [Xanthomonadaceae bacterium]TWT21962.1 FAD-dependent oxidoreductase [Luteimonas wenzhouensis]
MRRRVPHDVAVVGGGAVGAACALALAREGLDVRLLDAARLPAWSAGDPDLRVYALAPDNVALLDSLEVWDAVRAARAQPYRRMEVWDAAGGEPIVFDADALARPGLGWIVENRLLVDMLWRALERAGVQVSCPARVEALEQGAEAAVLRLEDGTAVAARIVVAADGAASPLRRMAGIGAAVHDYGQQGVVGYVRTASPHQDTAWQRFLPTGPLALLPWVDGACSIVWTLPADEATRILALDDDAFADALTTASGARLGEVRPLGRRAGFPLRRQLSDRQYAGRVLVVGDAAHAVHPLAGQGVNLGLRDVAALRDQVARARGRGVAWDAPHRLARWARARRSDSAVAAYAFEGLNLLFSNDAPLPTLLRGPALGLAGRVPPLVALFWRRAAGA